MTNLGKDHWDTIEIPNCPGNIVCSSLVTQLELKIAQLETKLIELEVHCANLTAKLDFKGDPSV